MQFRLANISGVDDAIISLYISRRNYSPQLADRIRRTVGLLSDERGMIRIPEGATTDSDAQELAEWLAKIAKHGLKLGHKRCHEVLLSFIDFSVETQGLHKAGMGDLDAHAQRMNNRIVRSSSRLASFENIEMSDYYEGRILTVGLADAMFRRGEAIALGAVQCNECGSPDYRVPQRISVADAAAGEYVTYVFNGFAYVRKDLWEDQDVQRGTYALAIPSDAIWRVSFPGLKHIYAMRHAMTHAHPELAAGIEQLADQAERMLPVVGMGIRHEWVGDRWVHVKDVVLAARCADAT